MIAAIRKSPKTGNWEFDYKDLQGRRKTKKGLKTKEEAIKAQSKLEEELKNGNCTFDSKMTFKEAAEKFMQLHASINCKYSTQEGYKSYLNTHINPFLGNMKLVDITPIMIREFIKQKLNTGRSNSTVNKYTKLIRNIFNFMIENGVVNVNPAARIKSLKEEVPDMRPLSTEEVQVLLSKTKQVYPDFYPLLFTALFTGMREGELLGLTWDSINWIKCKIKVDKNFTHNRVGTPKSNKARYVDMSKELVKVLKEWRLACPHSELNLVFPNQNGRHQNPKNMTSRRFKPALQRAGIEEIRFHDLRHTYASLMLVKGADMKYVQHQLGHSTIKLTMDRYTHLLPEINEKCVNMLDDILNTSLESKDNIKRFGT